MADFAADTRDGRGFGVPELPIATWDAHAQPHDDSDACAALIFDAWYVIALSKDVGRTLGSIKALGQPLVYFRAEDGRPVVLDDRCAHRRFPLSKGRLTGDSIQCGYHGFTYAASGQCVWAPGAPVRENGFPFGVRSYPCAERGPWLWVWMGRPERADPSEIPMPDMQMVPGGNGYGYKLNPSNYMLVIENLLDLSHLHFLHGATDVAHVAVPPQDAPAPANGVKWTKTVERTEIGLIGGLVGDAPARGIQSREETTQFGPSLNFGVQRRQTLPDDPEPIRLTLLQIAHAITPQDERSTHQFFMNALSAPFLAGPEAVVKNMEDYVFEQDVDAVRWMQAYIDEDVRPGRVEFSMAYDRFGLKMREILKEMKARELSGA